MSKTKAMNPPKTATMTQALRWHLKNADETTHAISVQTGIDHSALYRFLGAQRGLSHDSQDKLAAHLKLRLLRA